MMSLPGIANAKTENGGRRPPKSEKNKFKFGYSDSGDVYIGKNIQADFHKLHAVIVILTLGEPFKIALKNKDPECYMAAVVQKDVSHNFSSGGKDHQIFIHLDPYSENGMGLTRRESSIQKLNIEPFEEALKEFRDWLGSPENDEKRIGSLMRKVCAIAAHKDKEHIAVDERIKKSLRLIRQSDTENLSIRQVARSVNLSPSRFAHLFKKETGLPFRKFLLHGKLMKSLHAIYERSSFTEASYQGGFSDQPHFTRTFKKAFGIKPSSSKK